MSHRYFLRSNLVRDVVDRHHLTHVLVARALGVSRAYWSQLLNRKRSLTPQVRRAILGCDVFSGVAETELWERVAVPAGAA